MISTYEFSFNMKKLTLEGLTYAYDKKPLHFLIERFLRKCPAYDCGHCITELPESKKIKLLKAGLDTIFRIPKGKKLTLEQWKLFTGEASDLGAKVAIFMGDGETTIHPYISNILEHHRSLGIKTILFTKGYTLNKEKSRFYHETDTKLMISVDTLNDDLYKELTKSKFSITKILEKILDAQEIMYQNVSSNSKIVPIAFNTIITQKNKEEIPSIRDFCDKNNIALYIIPPIRAGRMLDDGKWEKYTGETKEQQIELWNYIKELGAIDPTCLKDGNGYCKQPSDALVIDEMGRIYPCIGICPDAFFIPIGIYPKISVDEAVKRRDKYVNYFSGGKDLKCIKHSPKLDKNLLQPSVSNQFVGWQFYDGYYKIRNRVIEQLLRTYLSCKNRL